LNHPTSSKLNGFRGRIFFLEDLNDLGAAETSIACQVGEAANPMAFSTILGMMFDWLR